MTTPEPIDDPEFQAACRILNLPPGDYYPRNVVVLMAQAQLQAERKITEVAMSDDPAPCTNDETLLAIAAWQAHPYVHPLTCGNDSRHNNLRGEKRDGLVVLVCPDCDYVQRWIPECVEYAVLPPLPPKAEEADDGPDGEDGPWAEGWAERSRPGEPME